MSQPQTPFDTIFLKIFWTRIQAIANEAAQLIIRTSFSTLSSEANDFAVVITNSQGQAIAENSGSIPSFIGTLPKTVQATINQIGKANLPDDHPLLLLAFQQQQGMSLISVEKFAQLMHVNYLKKVFISQLCPF